MRVLVLLFLAITGFAADGVRVGIVGLGSDTQSGADLLTVALSKNSGVVLLERAELDRVAREKALTLGQSVEGGKLLGADGPLFLEGSGPATNRSAALRLVGVKQGVILYSTRLGWPPKDLEEWSGKMAEKLAPYIKKAGVPAEKAVKISVLNLRSAINSTSQQLLERELTALLLSRLAQETELFVLERRQLGAAVFEKELQASEEKFWTGSHLLDGTINRDGFDLKRVTISARLRAPDGSENAIEVAGAPNANGKLIDELVGKILAALKIEKRASWDPTREAAQHLEEAKWALRWGMWKEAQAAADSAWALGEQSLEAATTRMLAYGRDLQVDRWRWTESIGLKWPITPPAPETLESPMQAVALIRDTLERNPNVFTNVAWWKGARECIAGAGETLANFYWRAEARVPVQDKLSALRASCRAIIEKAIQYPDIRRNFWLAPDDNRSPDVSEDYFRNGEDIFSIYARYAGVFHEKPDEAAAVYRMLLTGDVFPYIRPQILAKEHLPRLGGWTWAERKKESALWEGFLEELNRSTNTLTQLEGILFSASLWPRDNNRGYTPGKTNVLETKLLSFIASNKTAILEARSTRRIGVLGNYGAMGWLQGSYFDLDQEYWTAYRARSEKLKARRAMAVMREKKLYDMRVFTDAMHVEVSTNEAKEALELLTDYRKDVVDKMDGSEAMSADGFLRLYEMNLNRRLGLPPPPAMRPRTNLARMDRIPPEIAERMAMLRNRALTNNTPGAVNSITITNRISGSNALARMGTNRPGFPFPPGGPMGRSFGPFGQANQPDVATIVSPNIVHIKNFWRAPGKLGGRAERNDRGLSPPMLRDGKLWFRYFPVSMTPDEEDQGAIYRVDLERWRTEETIVLDGAARAPFLSIGFWFEPKTPRNFEVLNSVVYAVGSEGAVRREGSSWRKLNLEISQGELWRAGTNLYLLSGDALQQIVPETGGGRLLAATRRRPARSPADELETMKGGGLTEGPGGALRAVFGGTSFLVKGDEWKTEASNPSASWAVSGSAAYSRSANRWQPVQFEVLLPWQEGPQFVARAAQMRPGVQPEPASDWRFSAATVMESHPFLLGTNVALITGHGAISDKLADADLFVFGPAAPKPIRIRLHFDVEDQLVSDRQKLQIRFVPSAVATEKELILGHPMAMGFWRIPRGEIDAEIRGALEKKEEQK